MWLREESSGAGRRLSGVPDWFITNVADAPASRHERAGTTVVFEDPDDRFPELGINIRVLEPGQPSSLYHSESKQEDFLVLGGECRAILDGEERLLKAWDFVHCPAGTAHVFIGAGEGPCTILMVGARGSDKTLHYSLDELAVSYGAAAPVETDDRAVAYAEWKPQFTTTRLPWPPSD